MIGVDVKISRDLLNLSKTFEERVKKAIDSSVDDAAQDIATTCSNWAAEDKPTIERVKAHRDGNDITGSAVAKGDVYSWNNYDAHRPDLYPKNAPAMVFRHSSGWTPKTRRFQISSGAGANSGPVVRTKHVRGYTRIGRHWDWAIAAKQRNPFRQKLKDAVKGL